jgi:putative DNA primase/helicase
MLTEGSGIAADVIAERGYYSVEGAQGYTTLKTLGFSQAQARLTPGLCLPLHTTDGQQPVTIYRPDNPQADARGRLKKYLLPKAAGVRLDCPPRCRPALAKPDVPLWLVEGQRKADSLASHGAVVLGLLGVWNFKGRNDFKGTTLLADFD